ncbi:acyl-CoA carboxylase subunit epsilon [Actinomadura rayongensis]|uniref:Acyl-CoA carboxylase subunit epsilon n=1 Tax=Actinomadura rayongensis TaxID=1429076 RepID=A0A6I4W4W4_9ACTN|nr:acyl-CoA carboxylase subunit epsilon [Actinomadura rayongensis]MXQ64353.1 acyl-CoA carboxylase subunit epsilon [Actinomadura rayongensis]
MSEVRPFLQVVRGDAAPEEVAALVAVLTARARGAAGRGEEARPRSRWADPARLVRGTPAARPGPGAWRAAFGPR